MLQNRSEKGFKGYINMLLEVNLSGKRKKQWRDLSSKICCFSLFIIARTWKQPRCPSADEWIRKLWYVYTMEYYSAIKKNSFESVLMRWMKLEPIKQSEVGQKDKDQVVSNSVRPHRWQPTRLPHPWDSPGKNTGVGCHFLLQCMKVKSESEVAQLCQTLSNPMDCSPPGSSVHGRSTCSFPGKSTGAGCHCLIPFKNINLLY